MHLDTIEIAPDEAKARLDEYAGMVASERTAEDGAIAAGYRAAARGLPVVRLSEVMAAGGWFENGLPRLAIARADTTTVFVSVRHYGGDVAWDVEFRDDPWARLRAQHVGAHGVTVPMPRFEPMAGRPRFSGQTIVPIIPPRFRPRLRRMHGVHILWEVERWDPTPPTDPALLRHIRGDLWAVLATWDLTPLERAVLSQRAGS
jgi:hypothetical protein